MPLITYAVAFSSSRFNCDRRDSVRQSLLVAPALSSSEMDILPQIREAVMGLDGGVVWEESTQVLSELFDSSEEEAELILADAFRWKSWALASDMFRRYQKPLLPKKDMVKEALAWLRDGPLQLTDDQIQKHILSHPQTYLTEPEKAYNKVLGSAPSKYRNARAIKCLVDADPSILQVW